MKTHLSNKNGFTLLEVMVAVVVLATLVLGGSATMSYARTQIERQRMQREAMVVASSVMDAMIYGNSVEQLDEWGIAGTDSNTNISLNGVAYSANSTFTSLSDGLGGKYVHVLVTVSSRAIEPVEMGFNARVN